MVALWKGRRGDVRPLSSIIGRTNARDVPCASLESLDSLERPKAALSESKGRGEIRTVSRLTIGSERTRRGIARPPHAQRLERSTHTLGHRTRLAGRAEDGENVRISRVGEVSQCRGDVQADQRRTCPTAWVDCPAREPRAPKISLPHPALIS